MLELMDFTQTTYKTLLEELQEKYNNFCSFRKYLELCNHRTIPSYILCRHDVDRLPQNSIKLAQLEHSLGIKGTYYFRIVPESYDLGIMGKIAALGHEIGYHYEDVDLAMKNYKLKIINDADSDKLIDLAYESFCNNLKIFRKNFDIKTICMHGSPRARFDNKLIWEKYNYKDLGIIGEPYYDIDFNQFAYFTDTGRRWNGEKVSVRDKVDSTFNFNFKSTQEIIDNVDKLPEKIMFTIHPERWHDNLYLWTKELIFQNTKNIVKRFLISVR